MIINFNHNLPILNLKLENVAIMLKSETDIDITTSFNINLIYFNSIIS